MRYARHRSHSPPYPISGLSDAGIDHGLRFSSPARLQTCTAVMNSCVSADQTACGSPQAWPECRIPILRRSVSWPSCNWITGCTAHLCQLPPAADMPVHELDQWSLVLRQTKGVGDMARITGRHAVDALQDQEMTSVHYRDGWRSVSSVGISFEWPLGLPQR